MTIQELYEIIASLKSEKTDFDNTPLIEFYERKKAEFWAEVEQKVKKAIIKKSITA